MIGRDRRLAARLDTIGLRYGKVIALDAVTLDLPAGCVIGLIGQSASERAWRTAELLNATGLTPFANRAASKLSGGMRQKLGLCCSLIHDPDLLILDEPTTGVDPLARDRLWELLIELSRDQDVTIFVSTHFMNEAERCDRAFALHRG